MRKNYNPIIFIVFVIIPYLIALFVPESILEFNKMSRQGVNIIILFIPLVASFYIFIRNILGYKVMIWYILPIVFVVITGALLFYGLILRDSAGQFGI